MPDHREVRLQPSAPQLRFGFVQGTHAMGANTGAGTISFPNAFAGTPHVTLTPLAGSSSFGRTVQLGVRQLFSGSFTYRGSPAHGTFLWGAMGPVR